MIAPDNRRVLLDLLSPPPGYQLDSGVGTTFTLGFDTALVVPLAFAASRLGATGDPGVALQAIEQVSERVDLFCQAGQMTIPARGGNLFAFLEPMIHEVRRPRPGFLFHPKVWLLRFVAEEEPPLLRLLTMTRNLTDGAAWDLAVQLEATRTARASALNRPLGELIDSLPGMAVRPLDDSRRARIASLAEDARKAVWEAPEGFSSSPTFWAFGLPATRRQAYPDFSGYRHLVVAPFLNEGGLRRIVPNLNEAAVTVVSTADDLEMLPSDLTGHLGDCRVVSAAANLEDPEAEQVEGRAAGISGLHAKLFAVERNRTAHIFIGSANATSAAFGGNVEFLVQLSGGATKVGIDALLDSVDGIGSILEPYSPTGDVKPDPEDEALYELLEVLRSLAEIDFVATVRPAGNAYEEVVTAPAVELPPGVTVRFELLTHRGFAGVIEAGVESASTFGPIELQDVTPFVVLTVSSSVSGAELKKSSVVRCRLVNDPEGRLDEILARQIDTREKFLRFLLLLLGLSQRAAGLPEPNAEGAGIGSGFAFSVSNIGVFELLARAAADQPKVLEGLSRLVARLENRPTGRAVLPEGFRELWDVMIEAQPRLVELEKADSP